MEVNLVLFKKNGLQEKFPLPSEVTIIGRHRGCDLCIPLNSVSRKHCRLNYDDGVLKIRDLSSRNGTVLNGEAVDEAVVKAGDSVKVGPLVFAFQIDGVPDKLIKPDLTAQKSARKDTSTGGITDEQFASFTDIEESGSLSDGSDLDLSEPDERA